MSRVKEYVVQIGEVQLGKSLKVTLIIRSRFIVPVGVTISGKSLDGIYEDPPMIEVLLAPGETREVSFTLPMKTSVIGRGLNPRFMFYASTPIESKDIDLTVLMDVFIIDLVNIQLTSMGATQVEDETVRHVETLGQSLVDYTKLFETRPPFNITVPLTLAGEVVETEHVITIIQPAIVESPDIPVLIVLRNPLPTTETDIPMSLPFTTSLSTELDILNPITITNPAVGVS
ncbi:MAG: hypothetical protein QXP81_09830 [Nitrososphaerota archaeon]